MAYTLIANTGDAPGNDGGSTTAIDTTGADLIVVSVSEYNDSAITGLTDSKGNTWTELTKKTGSTPGYVRLFYSAAPTVGSGHTFTFTSTGSAPMICVTAWSDAHASPFDQESGTDNSATPGSITPSEDDCLLITAVVSLSGSVTIDGGFTISDQEAFAPSVNMQGAMAYLIQTSAAAANPTWSAASQPASVMASFKAAAGGGGATAARYLTLLGVG